MNFIHTLAAGGPVMIPLFASSFAAVAVIIERLLFLRRAARSSNRLFTEVERHLADSNTVSAVQCCEAEGSCVGRMMAAGVRSAWQGRDVGRALSERAMTEIAALNRGMALLDTVVTIAPLLGLLGTVTGMIGSFGILSRTGANQPTGITAGVAEALIATATGLVIAIISLVAHNYFQSRVKGVVAEMELRGAQLEHFLETVAAQRPVGAASEC